MFEITGHALGPGNGRSATALTVSLHAAAIAAVLLLSSVGAVSQKPADHVTQITYLPRDLRPVKAARPATQLLSHREKRPALSELPLAKPEAPQGQVGPVFETSVGEIASATGFGGNGPVASGGWDAGTGGGRGFLPGGPATSGSVFDGPGTNRPPRRPRQEADEPAELLPGTSPEYTPEAKRRGVTGEVRLEVELRFSGEVHVLRIVSQPLGYGLEDVAVRAANRYRCKPARKGGRAITVIGQIKVTFTLNS